MTNGSRPPAVPEALLARIQKQQCSEQTRRRTPASDWDGKTYGYGAARAHPAVEFARCPVCPALPGQLCQGPRGVHWSVHYKRSEAYRALREAAKEQLRRGE